MVSQKNLLKTLLLGCGFLFCMCTMPAKAQIRGRSIIEVEPPTRIRNTTKPRIIKIYVQPTFTTVKKKPSSNKTSKGVISKTGDLSISTVPGAAVSLKPLDPKQKPNTKTADKKGLVVFEDLPAAKYQITAELAGFQAQQQDVFEILADRTQAIDLDLKQITYNLSIETNIKNGEVRYAPSKYNGMNKDGSLNTTETGGYCIEPIKNNKAVIKGLKNGFYDIDVRPYQDDIKYDEVKKAIEVSDKTVGDGNDSGDETLSVKVVLPVKLTTEEFSSGLTKDEWDFPPTWKLDKLMKTNSLPGIALPRNYRYYTDFEMISDVRSLDGNTVNFVVRASEDEKNYYLIQISGEKSADPFIVKPYIVLNNEAKQLPAFRIPHFVSIIRPQKSFRVIIRGDKNVFKILIEDETGEAKEVGNFVDQYENLKKGAVGIAGSLNSNFEVLSFKVCPGKCN